MNKSLLLVQVFFLAGCLAEPALQRTVMHAFEDPKGRLDYDASCATCYNASLTALLPTGSDEIPAALEPAASRAGSVGGPFSGARVVSAAVLASVRPGFVADSPTFSGVTVAAGIDVIGFSAVDKSQPLPAAQAPLRLKLDTKLASIEESAFDLRTKSLPQ